MPPSQPSQSCLTARASLNEIRSLKRDFEAAYDLVVTSGKPEDIKKAQGLKRELESKIKALQETLAIVEAERLFNLKRQYESQTALLKKTGLIETKKETDASGVEREVLFMTAIDGHAYPVPSYDTIVSRLAEQKELLTTKADQGFTKLLLVPFGMSLDAMILKFKAYLLTYKKAYDKTHKKDTPPSTFSLDENQPVWVWEEGYKEADVSGSLVYDPVSFDADHNGKTKVDILAEQQTNNDTSAGWRVLLLQGGDNSKGFKSIPRSGNGQVEGAQQPRHDIEAGKSPRVYLSDQLLGVSDTGSSYHGESGMTPEEWITMFMAHLEETGNPMDDYQNNTDSIAYLTGAYFTASGGVPGACWDRVDRQADLGGFDPGRVGGDFGVRSSVRV